MYNTHTEISPVVINETEKWYDSRSIVTSHAQEHEQVVDDSLQATTSSYYSFLKIKISDVLAIKPISSSLKFGFAIFEKNVSGNCQD